MRRRPGIFESWTEALVLGLLVALFWLVIFVLLYGYNQQRAPAPEAVAIPAVTAEP